MFLLLALGGVGMSRKHESHVTARWFRRLQEAGGKIIGFLTSMRSCKHAAVDSIAVEAKRGEAMGYDRFSIGRNEDTCNS
jgi:hypothetical protein